MVPWHHGTGRRRAGPGRVPLGATTVYHGYADGTAGGTAGGRDAPGAQQVKAGVCVICRAGTLAACGRAWAGGRRKSNRGTGADRS